MPRPQRGHEEFPEPAGRTPAHRHPSTVPGSEVADDADRLRVGRPYRKGDALCAFVDNRVGAELLVACEMVSLGEQINVELAQYGGKAIDIVKSAREPPPRHAQPIAKRLLPIRDLGD